MQNWRQNEFKFEPKIFLSGQKLAAVAKGIQSPGHGEIKSSLTPSLADDLTRARCFFLIALSILVADVCGSPPCPRAISGTTKTPMLRTSLLVIAAAAAHGDAVSPEQHDWFCHKYPDSPLCEPEGVTCVGPGGDCLASQCARGHCYYAARRG